LHHRVTATSTVTLDSLTEAMRTGEYDPRAVRQVIAAIYPGEDSFMLLNSKTLINSERC
jgi:uncharacterized protein YqfB (UPF0267 family)